MVADLEVLANAELSDDLRVEDFLIIDFDCFVLFSEAALRSLD